MIYKSNKLLYLLILIYTHILNAYESTISFHRHDDDVYDDFDITTIYRITDMSSFNSSNGTFNVMNSVIEIHSRTNAIGMPIQDNDDIHIIPTNINEIISLGSFSSTSDNSIVWNLRNIDLKGYQCNKNDFNNYRTMDTGSQLNKCYNAFESHDVIKRCLKNIIDHPICNFFTIVWLHRNKQTCLTMTYYYNNEGFSYQDSFVITMNVYDQYNNKLLLSSTLLDEHDYGIRTLKITNIHFKKYYEYKLSLQFTVKNNFKAHHFSEYFKFGLIRIAQCSNFDEEDVRVISVDHVSGKIPKPFNILGNRIVEPSNDHGTCLNGGYIIKESSKCVCPPGFKGTFCETGCGANSYGSDCKGVCSIQSDKMCRGMFMCTSYGCTCPAGLTGPSCNEDCTMGTYGADCRQTCSKHCLCNKCDRYTGVCLNGCSDGYILPYCTEKNVDQIKNLTTTFENGKIKVNWILVNSHQHYTTVDEPVTSIIKYKVKRILSCSIGELEQNWTSITILNETNYEIFDTVPNSQYIIQVLVEVKDKNTSQQEKMIDVFTPASKPQIEPILDPDHPMCIKNNSLFVQWKLDPENCSKLNGFLSQFYIELKNKVDNILQIRETENNYISFNELKPNTTYELKVFIKTHFGYNPKHFLLTNFTTKYEYLKPVEDLVVYKKSLKNRMVGFRWSYSQDTNVDGFIVSFDENHLINTKNVSIIPPQKCSAWPEYYCHTFYNLTPSNNYTFKIKPKSIDYPEGGFVASISFNSIDGLPDSPMNLKTTGIGSTTIALQWDIPWIFNGLLKMFIINIQEISSNDMNKCCATITPTEIPVNEELPTYNHTITGLQPGSTYSIGVLTLSKSLWYSTPSRLSVTLPTIQF